jgi:hypothetical protein
MYPIIVLIELAEPASDQPQSQRTHLLDVLCLIGNNRAGKD